MPDPIASIFHKHNLLASGECLACDVCCRFPLATSMLAPFFSNGEIGCAVAAGMARTDFPPGRYGPGHAVELAEYDSIYRCPAFAPGSNECRVYSKRPLDCRLYPFMLMYDAPSRKVLLGIDSHCPVIADWSGVEGFDDCVAELADLLDGALLEQVLACRGLVGAHSEHVRPLQQLAGLSHALCGRGLGLARVTRSNFHELEPFLEAQRGSLSYHALAPIYVWSGVFDLYWKVLGERAAIFAVGDGNCFLIAPPMGAGDLAGPAREALDIMRALDPNAPSPRIQDADDAMSSELVGHGWTVRDTHEEFVYERAALASLKGNRYYQKRRLCRKFEEAVPGHVWRAFAPEDFPGIVALYRAWMDNRVSTHPGEFYAAQAEASLRALICALREAESLGLVARVLLAGDRVVGFTAACPLHDGKSVHVLFEVTDLRVIGAAQFMFQALCCELSEYQWVNAGGASGLENLRRVRDRKKPLWVVNGVN